MNGNAESNKFSLPSNGSLSQPNYSAFYSLKPPTLSIPNSLNQTQITINSSLPTSNFQPFNNNNNNNIPDKYNHLAFLQQKEKILSNSQPMFNPALIQQNSLYNHANYHLRNNSPLALNQQFNINSYNNQSLFTNSAQFPLQPSLFNTNNSKLTSSQSTSSFQANTINLFKPFEQEVDANGYLNLIKPNLQSTNQNSSNHIYTKSSNQIKKPKKPNDNMDLIDLETSLDFKEMSVFDLFDPLVAKDIENKRIEMEKSIEKKQKEDEIKKEQEKEKQKAEQVENNKPVENNNDDKENIKNNNSVNISKRRDAFKRKKTSTSPNDKRLNRIESFNLIDVNIAENFDHFNKTINDLKELIDIERKELSNLIVFSPILDCPISNRNDIKINIRFNNTNTKTNDAISNDSGNNKRFQVTITPSLNATIETIVYNVLSMFNIEDLNTDKYLIFFLN